MPTKEILILIVFFGIFIGIFVTIIVSAIIENRRDKQRIVVLREQAEQMGLQFVDNPDGEAYHQFDNFKLFSRGREHRVSNLIEGDSGEVKISIFDYQFLTGGKKSNMLHRQTIVAFRSEHLRFPEFTMRPEIFLDKLGPTLGMQDLDFKTHPEFSKLFVLEGPDEAAIRSYFTPAVLEFFERHPNNSLEASDDTMFFYRERQLRKPEELKDLLAHAYEAYGSLREDTA